jgi:hypothetical protein
MRFSVRPDAGNAAFLRLMKEMPERAKAVVGMLPYLAAQFTYKHLLTKIPRTSEFKGYRRGLEIARIRGTSTVVGYSVRIDPKNRFVKTVDPNQVVVNVKIKETRMMPVDPEIRVLIKYNPWTMETLPFIPDKRQAQVVSKKATRKEVIEAAKRVNAKRSQWQMELTRYGIKPVARSNRITFSKATQNLPNLILRALQTEFGLGKDRPKPIWHYALGQLKTSGIHSLVKQKKYWVFPLTEASDKVWKKWPPKTRHLISSSEAQKYVGFERKLGIKR